MPIVTDTLAPGTLALYDFGEQKNCFIVDSGNVLIVEASKNKRAFVPMHKPSKDFFNAVNTITSSLDENEMNGRLILCEGKVGFAAFSNNDLI